METTYLTGIHVPHLFSPGSSRAMWLPLIIFALGISMAIIGIAGPTWHRTVIPGQKVQAVVLVAMDLSASMDATDIPPSRLERAKLKLSDFLGRTSRRKGRYARLCRHAAHGNAFYNRLYLW